MERQRLPSFQKLLDGGFSSGMRSVYPFVTGPAWTSLFSGVNPGKHGIFDQYQITESGIRTPDMRNCTIPFLWDYLSWAGKKTLVMGVPFNYPAPKINGIFVTGYFAPRLSCYPEDIKKTTDLSGFEYGEISVEDAIENVIRSGSRKVSSRMLDDMQKRKSASLELMDSSKWDVVVLVEALPDELFHWSYDDAEIVDKMFRLLDGWLGELLARRKESDSLVVVSDHGFSSTKAVLLISEWLRMKKYLTKHETFSTWLLSSLGVSWDLMSRPNFASKTYGFLARNSPGFLNILKAPLRNKMILNNSQIENGTRVKAFASGGPVAWLKLLPHENGNAVDKDLEGDLDELKTQGILKNFYRSEDLFSGEYLHQAIGEFVIEAAEGYAINATRLDKGKLLVQPILTNKGHHRSEGIFLSYGALQISREHPPSILDVLPTLLSTQKLPLPAYLDGRSLVTGSIPEWRLTAAEAINRSN